MLEPFDPLKPIILAVDASSYGVGAVLSHMVNNVEKPVCFASSTLTPAQANYAQVHKEALAVVFGITKFHKYLYGAKFTLVTDNTAIKEIFNPSKGTSAIAVARLQRWALQVAGYQYVIEHRPGKLINHADALSRLPLPENNDIKHVSLGIKCLANAPSIVNLDLVRSHQKSDELLSKIYKFVQHGWPNQVEPCLKPYSTLKSHFGIDDGVLYFDDRVAIPESLKSAVIRQLHSNHDGIVRMKMLGRSYVWWKHLDKDLNNVVQQCVVCQQRQSVPREHVDSSWSKCERPLQRIHLDLFHFESNVALIIVDAFSKYIDIRLLKSSNSLQVIEQVESFFAYFGIAEEVVSDNGPPFNSELFETFLSVNGAKVSKSPPYHPQSNGLAERGVRTVKDCLKKYLLDEKCKPLSLSRKINRFLISYRNTPCTVTNRTPSSMLYSYTPRTLVNLVNPRKVEIESVYPKNVVSTKCVPSTSSNHAVQSTKTFTAGEKVFYRNHFKEIVRWIPAVILQKLSPLTYLINVDGNVKMVHVNQIRHSDLSDKFHPSMPITPKAPQPAEQYDESSSDDTDQTEESIEAQPDGGNQNQPQSTVVVAPRKKSHRKAPKTRQRVHQSPKVRRSNRLKGQPRLMYPK